MLACEKAKAIADQLAAVLPVRMVELNNCFARAYVQAMAVCAEGHPCSAVVVRRGAFFEVPHPSGSYACTERVDGALKDAICHSVRWDWHVATGLSLAGADWIIDAGLNPRQPLMLERQWTGALGIAGDVQLKRFEVPGSLAMRLSNTRGAAVGDKQLEPALNKRCVTVQQMPRFSRFDVNAAALILKMDFDSWAATYPEDDCTRRRAEFEQYLEDCTEKLEGRGVVGG